MSDTFYRISWIFLFGIWITSECQETNYLEPESETVDFFQITDSIPLTLNQTYCLKRISVKLLPSKFLEDSHVSHYYVQISWESKTLMDSVKLESDSLNDSYCEAKNKHYYYRRPLNQNNHIFPDEVNEGIRFLPIKLDCSYVITPELEGICRPLRLRYSTPVCINKKTCNCRNINMPGPNLEGTITTGRINVFWSFPTGFNNHMSSAVFTIYSVDGINTKKLLKKKKSLINLGSMIGKEIRFKYDFPLNTSTENLYRIQGYFENDFGCRGNSTFLLIQNTKHSKRLKYDKIVSYMIASAFLLMSALLGLIFFRKRQMQRIGQKLFPSLPLEAPDIVSRDEIKNFPMVWNPTYEDQSKDSYLFDYRDLRIVKELASGNFGVVYLAYSSVALRGCHEFAIKQIKDAAGPEGVTDFMEEINVFRLVGEHQNVVRMFGYCSAPQPLTIIMEYVPYNLLVYLKSLREEFQKRKPNCKENAISYAQLSHSRRSSDDEIEYNYISQTEVESLPLHKNWRRLELEHVLDSKELEAFGLQIARGMAHLESLDIVHRDLAARNVLMDDAKVLKISDFGMSRSGIYVNRRSRKFPLRWMSPEALVSRVFTNKSDVWAFGVVLWEIGTLGAFPYSSLQNEEVISLLQKGGHLGKPENVTAELYGLMVECWALCPGDRPSFVHLVERIANFCQKSAGYVEFENLESNYVFPPMKDDFEEKKMEKKLHS